MQFSPFWFRLLTLLSLFLNQTLASPIAEGIGAMDQNEYWENSCVNDSGGEFQHWQYGTKDPMGPLRCDPGVFKVEKDQKTGLYKCCLPANHDKKCWFLDMKSFICDNFHPGLSNESDPDE